jgi:hypothetical protein
MMLFKVGDRVISRSDDEAHGTVTIVHGFKSNENDERLYTVKFDYGGHELMEGGELRKEIKS